MRIMHDASGIEDNRYMDIREYVHNHISGKDGIAHIRSAYDALFADYAFPGGYQIMYTTDSGAVLCGDCARKIFIMEKTDVSCDIYFEGPMYFCDECNAEIESAYGDPEDN